MPQEFTAVNVTVNVVPALAATGVKVVASEFGFEKVPLGADHATDCCPCAVPVKETEFPAQTVPVSVPASTVKV
mgnify:CR=1 FL=1